MYFTGSIQVYDVIDQLQWTVLVRQWHEADVWGRSEEALRLVGRVQGEGQDNPSRWLRQALEDIRESM